MALSPLINQLVDALQVLPGVGPKTAIRNALFILQHNRDAGIKLSTALKDAVENIRRCTQCRTLTEEAVCNICANPRRDQSVLCVVESPSDILAIEETATFSGRYFVLHGRLSPIDGVGPADLGLNELRDLVLSLGVREVILATNTTVEGEATAHYIGEILKGDAVTISRIAHGVPLGGELEYVDGGTIVHAIRGRRPV